MKARVKSTGVLVDVTPQLNINSQHSRDYLYVCDNMVFKECELDFSAIDWEQRRYELAKDIIKAVVADDCGGNSVAYRRKHFPFKEMEVVKHILTFVMDNYVFLLS